MTAPSTTSSITDKTQTVVAPDGYAEPKSKTEANILPDVSNEHEEVGAEQAESLEAKSGTDVEKVTVAAPRPGEGFPDGGLKAWSCVVGAFFSMFVSFGWINCVGVFQAYYQTTLLSYKSPSTVAWIPSLELFFMFVAGPFLGKLYDSYGPRYILLVGSFLHVFGLMMTSLATQYYQFILAQGMCSSLGASAIFFCAISSTSTWFFHRRALAIGVVASGSSLGGVILPIMVQRLIPKIGFPWTMRACAFMILGLLVIANLTVRSRLPPAKSAFSPDMLTKPFKELPFQLLTLGSFLFFLGLFLPFNFLILEAEAVGVDPYFASYLIPILNAVSILGRTLPGYLGDRLGRFNILVIFCSMASILSLALWIPGRGKAALIVFAVFYGFASGAFVSIVPACLAQISPIKEIGLRNGNLFALISIAALIGNPVAGALLTHDDGKYLHLQIFGGVVMVAGSLIMLGARASLAGLKLKKV